MRIVAPLLALSFSAGAWASDDAGSAYRLETSVAPIKVKKGATGTARVEVIPRKDAHVSPEAPLSLTVAAAPGIKVAKAKLGRADAKETKEKGVQFDVPFTAEQAGKSELRTNLTFFICTEKLCERQKRDLAFAVEVE